MIEIERRPVIRLGYSLFKGLTLRAGFGPQTVNVRKWSTNET